MKQAIHQSYVLLLTLSIALFLSSFSLVPPAKKNNEAPPQVQKGQQKIEKRKIHLRKRLAQTNSTARKKRLQRRLERLEKRERDVQASPVLGILGFAIGILALLVLIISLGISAAAALSGAGVALLWGNILFWGGIGLAVVGLGLSILHLVLRQQDQDRYNKPGFAIAGIILNGLLLGFLLLAALGGSIELASAY